MTEEGYIAEGARVQTLDPQGPVVIEAKTLCVSPARRT
jgi:hypothetical protein